MIHRELPDRLHLAAHSDAPFHFNRKEPSGGASGQATDISIHAKEILRIRELLTEMYAEHCEVDGETFQGAKDRFGMFRYIRLDAESCDSLMRLISYSERALERDHFMTAKEALDFGIIDKIVQRRPASASGAAEPPAKDKM